MKSKKDRIDHAAAMFKEGYSCSQAVLSTYADEFGIDTETALRLSSGFGGGMARQGKTCGAVTGALMVIGLKYGFSTPTADKSKEYAYAIIHKFTKAMEKRFHTTICNELVGHNISTPAGHEAAKNDDVFNRLCPGFVQAAIEILEGELA